MPTLRVPFGTGIQDSAKLGTVILKPTRGLSYAQNIDVQNDEYGESVALPGPSVTTLTTNSELTGVPFAAADYKISGYLWFLEGLLGATNIIRRISDLLSGSTPDVATGISTTISHSGHSTVVATDIAIRVVSATWTGYIVGKDATDGWVQTFSASSSGDPTLTTLSTLSSFNVSEEPKIFLHSNENLYIAHGQQVDTVDTADAYDNLVHVLPSEYGVTTMAEWQLFLVTAYSTNFPWTSSERLGNGRSGLILWDTTETNSGLFVRDVPCPARYISAVVNSPNGDLLVFGGKDEGKTTLFLFTGYGFKKVFSYIGDLPRSNHSITFDGQGRILWLTADGQLCRYNFNSGVFEHLASVSTGSSAGGLLKRGISGNEFILASGSGSTYTAKRVTFGSYIGDGDAGSDGVTTPLAISGQQFLPPGSTITGITVHLTKNLATDEKIGVRVYKNGSTTPTEYMDLAYAADGAISAKRKAIPISQVNNFALGVAWKQTDALATAPPVAFAEVEWEPTIN